MRFHHQASGVQMLLVIKDTLFFGEFCVNGNAFVNKSPKNHQLTNICIFLFLSFENYWKKQLKVGNWSDFKNDSKCFNEYLIVYVKFVAKVFVLRYANNKHKN